MVDTEGWKNQHSKPWGKVDPPKFEIPKQERGPGEFFEEFRREDGSPKDGFNERNDTDKSKRPASI